MALVLAHVAESSLVELKIVNSVDSLVGVLDSQRELFESQIDQLQKLVVTQCKLTGVNPLSQEMAAGALSIKIGKKPRDLLNPKAVKYMQSIFSIKDTVGKKESREISALCGITATQVKEYFAGQRSKVRKLVRLSKEKATISDASKAAADGCSSCPDQSLLVSDVIPLNTIYPSIAGECTQVPGTTVCTQVPENSGNAATLCTQVTGNSVNAVTVYTQVPRKMGSVSAVYTQVPGSSEIVCSVRTQEPGNTGFVRTAQDCEQNSGRADLERLEGRPSCSLQEDTNPGIDSEDRKFLENIFNLMRKEVTFSGQLKLMEWILKIDNSVILNWFSTKGGIPILATWLSEAAHEEQTSVIRVIFEVLCHVPLHKALPIQVSAILQTVNKLRFYRTTDISDLARVLLSRWSKMLGKQSPTPSRNLCRNGLKGITQKRRIHGIASDDVWQSQLDIPEEILALAGSNEDTRSSEPRKGQKLLQGFCDGPTKKHGRSVSSPKNKERRKVLLVEHPDSKSGSRIMQVARAVPSNNSRPMSADDIQKAKMRAMYMQDKYGKAKASTSGSNMSNTEEHKALPVTQAKTTMPVNGLSQLPNLRRAEIKRNPLPRNGVMPYKAAVPKEEPWEKLKRNQIQWQTPPEVRVNPHWKVGAGDNSKEVQVQTQRNQREKETIYPNIQTIPPNPKEPWDIEMDFDDSLTPEIPTDQPPDLDSPSAEPSPSSPCDSQPMVEDLPAATTVAVETTAVAPAAHPATTSNGPPEAQPTTSNGPTEPDLELLAVLLKNPDLVFALTSSQGKNITGEQTVALLDMLKKTGIGLTGIINGMVNSSKAKEPEPQPTSLPSPTPPSDASRATAWRSDFPQVQPQLNCSRGAIVVPNVASQASHSVSIPMAVNKQTQPLGFPPQAPTTILSLPQLTVTVNATPQQQLQHHPVLNYPQSQQIPNPEVIRQSNHYQVNNPSALLSTHLKQQPLLPEQQTMQPKIAVWPPAAGASTARQWNPALDSWTARPNGMSEVPVASSSNSHFLPNHNNNNYNNTMYPRRNEIVSRPEMESWSHEGSRSPEYWQDRNYSEPRRDGGRSQRPEWARQSNFSHQDHHQSGGGRKRRDRGRDRRW